MDTEKKEMFQVEEAFARLEEINRALENPQTSLKDSMALYAEGVKLVAACKESLQGVEQELKVLDV